MPSTNRTDEAPSAASISSSACSRPTLGSIDKYQKAKHKVYAMEEAEQYYKEERYHDCAARCYEVLRGKPSEAIQAKCHTYLAMEIVGPEQAAGRAYHAEMAVSCWNAVINRSGTSRYPVFLAKRLRMQVVKMAEQADALAKEEDDSYISEEEVEKEDSVHGGN